MRYCGFQRCDMLIQLLAGLLASIGTIADGMQYGWSSPIIPLLEAPDSPIKITSVDEFWLENTITVGAVCGIYVTAVLLNKIGPKRSIILGAFVKLIGLTLIGSMISLEAIYAGRMILGMCANVAFISAPMYIGEIADPRIRGFLGSSVYIMMLVGVLLVYTVGPFVSIPVSSGVAAVFALIQLVTFPFMPESPYYLISTNKISKARLSLERLRNSEDVEEEVSEIKAAIERQKAEAGKVSDLFTIKSNRKALIIMTFLNAAQHLGGISVMVMNVETILNRGKSIVAPTTGAILFSCSMLLAAFLASALVDAFGRKALLISSSFLTGISMLTLGVYFSFESSQVGSYSWWPIICVIFYGVAFKCGLGMVPIVTTGELFPTSVKAVGMAFADASFIVFTSISIFIYQYLSTYGMQYPFYVFSISCFCTIIFTVLCIPETKGKTLEEIQMVLKCKGYIHYNNKYGSL